MEITKKKLKEIYDKHSVIEAAKILEMSVPTLYQYLREAGIKLKGRGSKKLKIKD